MEKVNWKVGGMSCTNCALTIQDYLEKKGLGEVRVNFIGGDVSFDNSQHIPQEELVRGIKSLGYQVLNGQEKTESPSRFELKNHLHRFLFCALFTLPLMLHMIPGLHIHWLMNPYVQCLLTLPVLVVGMNFFGRSAWNSLTKGIPNMNVLIALGALAAFGYSLYGTLANKGPEFQFYETTATILTLVFLGYWLEDKSVESTQRALKELAKEEKIMANMIAFDDQHQEHIFPVESSQLKTGDLLLIKSGEKVPADAKILWGEAGIDESLISGESLPVQKKMNDLLIGGSVVVNGTLKAYVTATGNATVLSQILRLVKDAQTNKPPIQLLADKISAIFVPLVIVIALITWALNFWLADLSFGNALLRGIAVLVISCPCAMGLATPAAVAAGLGRAARNGVLVKNAASMELFRHLRQIVFDKTGTLTTGGFVIRQFEAREDGFRQLSTDPEITSVEERQLLLKKWAFSLEKYSNHPLALAITREWKGKDELRWNSIEEMKGIGVKGIDKNGDEYLAGSYELVKDQTTDDTHNIYITKNGIWVGWIDLADEIRPEAPAVIQQLKQAGYTTILLSGDRNYKCQQLAEQLGIDTWYGEQSPEQKLNRIATLNAAVPTAMVGDGINDAPALAKATIGISVGNAAQIAMQSAHIVLMNKGLTNLPLALGIGKATYQTIRQNLFWAFAYNIIAIPMAAIGMLSPALSALAMGFSDVVLGINSVRLLTRKIV
ncbi:MAG: cation-translocating P-type ATPase [Chitinophagaceae bacterium]|nr:cation-translocating P-type ATPase [Chitinophagaceae bacterium]